MYVIGYISSLAVYNIAQDGELCVPLELAAGCQTKPVAGLPLYGHCRPSVYLLKHRWCGGVNQSFRYPEVLWGVNLVEILIQEWMFWSSITEVNESKWGNPKPTAQRPKGWPRRRQERQGNKKIILTPGWRTLMTSAVMSMFKSRNIQDSGSDAPIAPPTHSNSKKLGPGILEPHVICSAQLLHPVPNTLLVQRHQS